MEKNKGLEKKWEEQNTKSGVIVAKSRWLETNNIQSQQKIPLLTEGRQEGSNVKSL